MLSRLTGLVVLSLRGFLTKLWHLLLQSSWRGLVRLDSIFGIHKGRPAVNLDAFRHGGIEHRLFPAPVSFLEELILTGYAEPGFVRIWAEITHFPFPPSQRPVRASPPGSQRRSRFSGMQKRKKKRRKEKGSPTWGHFSSKCRKMEYFKGHRWACWSMLACLPSRPLEAPACVHEHARQGSWVLSLPPHQSLELCP